MSYVDQGIDLVMKRLFKTSVEENLRDLPKPEQLNQRDIVPSEGKPKGTQVQLGAVQPLPPPPPPPTDPFLQPTLPPPPPPPPHFMTVPVDKAEFVAQYFTQKGWEPLHRGKLGGSEIEVKKAIVEDDARLEEADKAYSEFYGAGEELASAGRQLGRLLPVAGTIIDWEKMTPLERGISLGIDTAILAVPLFRGAKAGADQTLKVALKKGLDKWVFQQSGRPQRYQSELYQLLEQVLGKDKSGWLARKATESLTNRKGNTARVVDDVVKEVRTLLLDNKGKPRPVADIMRDIEGTAPRAKVGAVAELKPKVPEGEIPKPVTLEVAERVKFLEMRLAEAKKFKPAKRPPPPLTKAERTGLIEEATQEVVDAQTSLKRAIAEGADAEDIVSLRGDLASAKDILKDANRPFDAVAYEKAIATAKTEDAAIIAQVEKFKDELSKLKAVVQELTPTPKGVIAVSPIRQAIQKSIDIQSRAAGFKIPADMAMGVRGIAKELGLDVQSAEFKKVLEEATRIGDISTGGAFITGWTPKKVSENIVFIDGGKRMVHTVRAMPKVPATPQVIPTHKGVVPPVKPPIEPPIGEDLFDDALKIITEKVIPAQKVARAKTAKIFAEERGKAFGEMETIFETPVGEATVGKAAEQLGIGRMERAAFEPVESLLSQAHKDAIVNNLATNVNLPKATDKFNAMIALKRLFSPLKYVAEHPKTADTVPLGTPLRDFEFELLKKAWGKDKADDIAKAIEMLAADPIPVDIPMKNYLLGLKNIPFGKPKIGETFIPPSAVSGRATPRTGLEAFKTELTPSGKGVSEFPKFPEESLLRQQQRPLFSEQFDPLTLTKAAPEAYKGQRLQELMIDLADNPNPPTTVAIAVKRTEQFTNLPPSARMKLLKILNKVGINAIDVLGIPKTIKFNFDHSFPGRQGAILGSRHPKAWVKAWKPSVKAMKNNEVAIKTMRERLADPEIAESVNKLKLDLYNVERGAGWMERPEELASIIAERIPGIRASTRAAGVFMNMLMTDIGRTNYRILRKLGAPEEAYTSMGELINWAGGRGTLPNWLKGTAGDITNKLLTSPRFVASRFEFPTKILADSPIVRKEAASMMASFVGMVSSIIGLSYLAGARVELDPRSSDAYKIQYKNKRIDIWVGYAQIIRMVAQMAPYVEDGKWDWSKGSRKDSSGKIVPISRWDVFGRFGKSKLQPGIGAIRTLMTGKKYTGEEVDLGTYQGWLDWAKESLVPAAIEEVVEAYILEGAGSAALSTGEFFGSGIQTYENKAKSAARSEIERLNKYRDSSLSKPDKQSGVSAVSEIDSLIRRQGSR